MRKKKKGKQTSNTNRSNLRFINHRQQYSLFILGTVGCIRHTWPWTIAGNCSLKTYFIDFDLKKTQKHCAKKLNASSHSNSILNVNELFVTGCYATNYGEGVSLTLSYPCSLLCCCLKPGPYIPMVSGRCFGLFNILYILFYY